MNSECANPTRECLIDPIKLENRLTSIETKQDYTIDELKGIKRSIQNQSGFGMSKKSIAGLVTVISTLLIGVIEALKSYFQSKG